MNKVFLIGRLTRDPELRYTNTNIPVARFSIAVNRQFSNQQGEREADFFNIVVWRKQGENVKNYLTQGSLVAIDGRLQTGSYDGEDGKKRYTTEIVADNVQFLDSKNSRNNDQNGTYTNQYQQTPFAENSDTTQPISESKSTDLQDSPFKDFGANIEINEDELPF